MESCKPQTISGFNSYLSEQRSSAGTCLLSLTKFDTNGLKTPYTDVDVRLVVPLTENTFVPGGSTNLYDAIGTRVAALDERTAHFTTPPNVLVVVLTDGEDNASVDHSPSSIREIIATHEAKGWTFVYLGSTRNALAIAETLGFKPGNARQFDVSRMHETMGDLAVAVTAFRAGCANGAAKTAFFAEH